jgi:hypothetical protein
VAFGTGKYFAERAKRRSIPKVLTVLKRAGVGNLLAKAIGHVASKVDFN